MMLNLLIFLPIACGVLGLFFYGYKLSYKLQVISSIIVSILLGLVSYNFEINYAGPQFIVKYPWLPSLNSYFYLGVDGISLPLLWLNNFIAVIVLLSMAITSKKHLVRSSALVAIIQGIINGIFLSLDSLLFYVFFEALLVPMYLLIGVWGGKERIYAATKFFLYTFLGSIFLLLAICYMRYATSSFSILDYHLHSFPLKVQSYLFWSMLIAFAVKIPMWPLHTWLPDAHVEAPTPGSMLLAAVTLKIGGYGLLRFLLPITPDASLLFSNVVVFLSLVAIIYSGLIALAQTNIKKLIAYSSIAHMGFVTLGYAVSVQLDKTTAKLAIDGMLMQMLSHGIISAGLFLGVGILATQTNTKLLKDYGGAAARMPKFAAFMFVLALANCALPGTSGFVGELLVLIASFKASSLIAVVAGISIVLSCIYMLYFYHNIFWGKSRSQVASSLYDINGLANIIYLLLLGAVIWLGFFPSMLFEWSNKSVLNLIKQSALG